MPANPAAWITTTAQRRAIDRLRPTGDRDGARAAYDLAIAVGGNEVERAELGAPRRGAAPRPVSR